MKSKLFVLILMACCATVAAAGTGAPTPACQLVTTAELQAALGGPVADGTPAKSGETDVCTFMTKSGGVVAFTVQHNQPKTTAADARQRLQRVMKEAKISDLPGAGDFAFLIESGSLGSQAAIFRGTDQLAIAGMNLGDAAKASAAVKAIAIKAASRF